jgi:hypothetical protein
VQSWGSDPTIVFGWRFLVENYARNQLGSSAVKIPGIAESIPSYNLEAHFGTGSQYCCSHLSRRVFEAYFARHNLNF